MGVRSKITMLPEHIREWLEAKLLELNFSGYRELCDELNAKLAEEAPGVRIARSSLHEFGQDFESRIAAMKKMRDFAKTLQDEVGDEEGAVNDALQRLAANQLFEILLELDVDPKTIDPLKLTHAIADLTRASVPQKKFQAQVLKQRAAAIKVVEEEASKGGLSTDTIAKMRKAVFEIGQ